MNLHKAKGLEADVVFLADPCGGVRKGVSRRIVRSGDGAKGWFQIERPGEGGKPGMVVAKPKGWDDHARIEKGFKAAEETRLLYVASTRAKQMLVVCRYAKAGQSRPWGALDASLGKATELVIPATAKLPRTEAVDLSIASEGQAQDARDKADAAVRIASWSITSATAEARHIARMAAAAEPASAEDPTAVVAADSLPAGPTLAWPGGR